ncbi:MAG TPA: glycosyltransferase family 2 protein, partial [Candidatus Paceibacterota bacterium]|nr:glycosyltransferase family 2 protein [Candidatus Paceibacterota bacterium]
MKNNHSFVSIIIPCWNEEKYIAKCLDSIVSQDYPKENLEVLIVDGMSEDKTIEIIKGYSERYQFVRLLNNAKKFTCFALNIGVKAAKGDIVILMGAHASYEKDYVSKCVKYLEEYDADSVGGVMKTRPGKKTLFAKAIAIVLSHPFGAGGSQFRTGVNEPKWVDTVFGGCYKKEIFDKIGLFNENLIRSQDMEFNLRLKKSRRKILLHPEIVSYYYPKSKLKDFFLHNINDGIWAILPLKFVKIPLKLRHYVPLVFVLTLPLSVWPYILLSLFFSAKTAFREKDF